MDNRNDIERNKQLRRIADALEKIAKNTQKSISTIDGVIMPDTTITYSRHGTILDVEDNE